MTSDVASVGWRRPRRRVQAWPTPLSSSPLSLSTTSSSSFGASVGNNLSHRQFALRARTLSQGWGVSYCIFSSERYRRYRQFVSRYNFQPFLSMVSSSKVSQDTEDTALKYLYLGYIFIVSSPTLLSRYWIVEAQCYKKLTKYNNKLTLKDQHKMGNGQRPE